METTLIDSGFDLDPNEKRAIDGRLRRAFEKGFEVYSGVQQADLVSAMIPLLEKFSSRAPGDIMAARTDMSKLKGPQGVVVNSRDTVANLGLSESAINDQFIRYVKAVTKAYIIQAKKRSFSEVRGLRLNKWSNSGFRNYTSDPAEKERQIMEGLRNTVGGILGPCKAFGGLRVSPDSPDRDPDTGEVIGKRRNASFPTDIWKQLRTSHIVMPEELSPSETEGYTICKTPLNGSGPFLSAGRMRSVMACSYIDNAAPMLLSQTLLDPAAVCPRLWHHRFQSDLEKKFVGKYVLATDFSEFDRTIIAAEIKAIYDTRRLYAPEWTMLFDASEQVFYNLEFTQGDVMYKPWAVKNEMVYYRSRANKDSIHGNISGHGLTAVEAKTIGASFMAAVLNGIGLLSDDDIDNDDEGLLLDKIADHGANQGDDIAFGFSAFELVQKGIEFIQRQKYKKVRQENPAKFLGYEIVIDESGKATHVTASVGSFIKNRLAPEHQSGTGQRKYAHWGLASSFENFKKACRIEGDRKIAEVFYGKLITLIPGYFDLVAAEEAEINAGTDAQTQFMIKYGLKSLDEIHYLLDWSEVDAEDIGMISLVIPKQQIISAFPELELCFR